MFWNTRISGFCGRKTCFTCDNVEFLLNTHWHFDHVSNNAYFGEHDTTIIAHSNVRDLLSSPQEQKAFGLKFDAYPEDALPIITFDDAVFLYFNDEKIHVTYLPNGHTNSDSIVYFIEAIVIYEYVIALLDVNSFCPVRDV